MKQRLPTWQFQTLADLTNLDGLGVSAGDLALVLEDNNLYRSVDPNLSSPTWDPVTEDVPEDMVEVNNEGYGLSDATVFADGQIPVPSTTGLPGWAYSNAVLEDAPKNKINWYFFSSQRQPTPTTLGDLDGVYALVQVNDIEDPIFLQVYTTPEGSGAVPPDAGSFFRSRITYIQPATPLTPGIYLFHSAGYDVTGIFPEYPRVECAVDPGTTVGPQDPTETILLANIATNSGAAAGSIDIVVRQTGIQTANLGRSNFSLEVDDLSPRLVREFGEGVLPAEIGPFETVIFTDTPAGTPGSVTTSLGTPTSYAEQKAFFLPFGNPSKEVVITLGTGVEAFGPDGQSVVEPGTLTYPAGTLPAGTQLTWRGDPTPLTRLGNNPRWYLSGTNYDTGGATPATPTWPETLAVGEKTEGVMPALQNRGSFQPTTEARDQLHTYWPQAGLPSASVGNAGNQTASYVVPIYAEQSVAGASNTPVAVIIEAGGFGGFQALVQVNLVAKQIIPSGPSDANLKFKTTVWVDSDTGLIEQIDTAGGDVANFSVTNNAGRIELTFTDATPGAGGVATIHGMALVQVATKLPPS